MKRIFPFRLFFVVSILLLAACQKSNDPEPSPTDARAKFLGDWNVLETKGKLSYPVTIVTDASASDKVQIQNFGDFNANAAVAIVQGNLITTIPNQTIGTVQLISGTGTYNTSSNTIVFSYTYNDQANQVTVNAIFSR